MAAATIAVAAVAAEGQPFTSDEVWGHLDAHHPSLAPPDPRAMGAAFTQSQRRGLITPTDVTRRSGRPTNHRPVRIWQPTKGDNT